MLDNGVIIVTIIFNFPELLIFMTKEKRRDNLQENNFESKYYNLINNMFEGFAYCKVITDKQNNPIDYVFLEVNKAFEELTGLEKENITGKRLTEVLSKELYSDIFDICNKVITEKESVKFEKYFKVLNKWFSILIYNSNKDCLAAVITDITETKSQERKWKVFQARYQTIIGDNNDELSCCFLPNGIITFVNKAYCSYFGKNREELIGSNFLELIPEEGRGQVKQKIESLSKTNPVNTYEHQVINSEGEIRWQQWTDYFIYDEDIEYTEIQSIGRDITERKRMEKAIQKKSREQELLLENINVQVWYLKDLETFGLVNKAHANFLGTTKEKIEGQCLQNFFNEQEVKSLIKSNKKVFLEKIRLEMEAWLTNSQGKKRLLSITKMPKLDSNGQVEYVICSAKDITKWKQQKEEIKYLSYYDDLTDVHNKVYFNQKVKYFNKEEFLPLSFIIGDINGLRLINNGFGYKVGDQVLIKVAQKIKASCREEDLIARLAGDEFAVLAPQTTKKEVQQICNQIKRACEKIKVEGGINPSLSLGYATKERIGEDINDVFYQAQEWMYKNKLNEGQSTHSAILSSLQITLREKTHETAEHAHRLKEWALKFGEQINLSDIQLTDLLLLAELHDLGKVAIPNKILQKKGSLSEKEWQKIKKHPEVGYQIAKTSPDLNSIAEAILSHHEWWDGTGYPQGLKGENIPLLARVIAILDAYDVMTNGRPYKQAMTKSEAIEELKDKAGTQFDPKLVKQFIKLLN